MYDDVQIFIYKKLYMVYVPGLGKLLINVTTEVTKLQVISLKIEIA